jgi:hypothetical protein
LHAAKKHRRVRIVTIFLNIMLPPYHLKQYYFPTYETMYAWRTPPSAISPSIISDQY